MYSRLLLPLLAFASITLARSLLITRQQSECQSGQTFYCCADDPLQYGGSACFPQTDPCDSETIYPYSYCCDSTDGTKDNTDFSTCYDPNAPPPSTAEGNACAPGQNLECCNGDPTDPNAMGVCGLGTTGCDPNSDLPTAYCCDQANGFTEFDTCKPAPNNGQAPG